MKLNVNGTDVEVDDRHEQSPLLWVLRDVLRLRGTKFGCGIGQSAACTVLIDGQNEKSCQTPAGRAQGRVITTVEGVAGPVADAVRDAWHQDNVVQCGYCQPGQTLAAIALLTDNPSPDDATISRWMNGNLCRCGTYPRSEARSTLRQKSLPTVTNPHGWSSSRNPRRCLSPTPTSPIPYIRTSASRATARSSCSRPRSRWVKARTPGWRRSLPRNSTPTSNRSALSMRRTAAGVTGTSTATPRLVATFQITGNSNSTAGNWMRYRLIAAQARARLVAAAAERWNVSAEDIIVEAGVLRHPSGHRATFGDLAAGAEQLEVPDGVVPKERAAYRLIGRDGRLRVDAPAKILGRTTYTIDVDLPDLLTAVVMHPPRFGATVAAIDDRAALTVPGVVAVVQTDDGVAAVGETPHDAWLALPRTRRHVG